MHASDVAKSVWEIVAPLFSGAVVAFVLWLRTRPGKLKLTLRDPELGKVRPAGNGRVYRHLLVENTRRHNPAHNVRVYLRKVEVFGQGGKSVVVSCHLPLYHQWEQNDLKRPRGEVDPDNAGRPRLGVRERTVGEMMIWDLCSIGRDSKKIRIEVAYASWNWDPPELEPKRTYVLTLQATSNEVSSKIHKIAMCWNGEWNDDTGVSAEKDLRVWTIVEDENPTPP